MSEPDDVALLRAEAVRGSGSMRYGVRNSLHELLDTAFIAVVEEVLNGLRVGFEPGSPWRCKSLPKNSRLPN
jgi:hypothetical protein